MNPTPHPDLEALEPDFRTWLTKLDGRARGYHFKGGSLVAQTGAECWREYYEEGYSVSEALKEDARNAY